MSTAVILAGGKSSRMGRDKTQLIYEGKTLLAGAVERFSASFDQVYLSIGDPEKYPDISAERVIDLYPGCGPMAGIHAALAMTSCDALVVAPCDAPYYCKELAQYLAAQYEPELDALVLLDDEGRAQPLSGIYSRSCLPVLEQHLKTDRLKIMRMLEDMRLKKVVLPEALNSRVFENLNTPEDMAAFSHRKTRTGNG